MKDNAFIYGTHYYRPPNPPANQHEYHLKKIKDELGFNLVRFRLQWNSIHRAPDKLDLDEVNTMFDICDRLDLNVLVETSLESAPYWLEKKHPESRYVSANGHAVELGPYDSTQSGGYPGLCFHNEAVAKEGESYLRKLINSLKGRKSLIGYDCWNEPHLEPAWICNFWGNMGDRLYCYCNASKIAFRDWLKNKYKDVETVNSTWARMFNDLEDVNPPDRHGTYADWMDWIRFWFDSLQEHMQWRYRIIKEEDPDRFVMSHSGAVPPFLARANAFINNWSLAAPVDKWGTSFAPKYHNWSLAECAGTMDASRSAARGKEFWISEMSGGTVYNKGFWKTPATRPKDIRAWNWLAILYGAKSIIYWCYLTESTGSEAGSFGLIRYNGDTTERALEAKKQHELIQKYHEVIEDYIPEPDVAILYDPDNSSLLFAMENSDELYMKSHTGFYRTIWENDLYARYVTYSTLEDVKEKILVVPMCLTLPSEAAQYIRIFVEKGGILITEARTGLFDERGFLQPELPSHGLDEVAGLLEDEAVCSDPGNRPWLNNPDNLPWPDEIDAAPDISVDSPCPVELQVHGYLAPLLLKGAECFGKWKDQCLAAKHKFGKGDVYYFGTYLGLALYDKDKGAHKLLSEIVRKYTYPKVRGDQLRPRLIEKDNEGLLAVFNDNRLEKFSERIKLPQGYKNALNVFNSEKLTIKDGYIEVTVGPEDVVVVYIDYIE